MKYIKEFNESKTMIDILKDMLNQVKDINEDDTYTQAIYSLMCGIGTSSEYKRFLATWFTNPIDLYSKLDDVENVCIYKISNTEFQVLAFSDGYEGYLFTFVAEGSKLKVLDTRKVNDEDDSIYVEDELSDSDIDEILK